MPDESTVGRNETHILDQTLRQQQTIERVPRCRLRVRNR
jgi:hypothetical protein